MSRSDAIAFGILAVDHGVAGMLDFPAMCPTLFRRGWTRRHLNDALAAIDPASVRAEYEALVKAAPTRALSSRYLGDRSGIPSSTGPSNRREEHVAMALANMQQRWPLPGGQTFELIDYQVPLKARRNDAGIGKVDLLGIAEDGRLVIIELKVAGQSGGAGDAPPIALMEAVRYAAILQANRARIQNEVARIFGRTLSDDPPVLLILGENEWWHSWAASAETLARKVEEVSEALGLPIVLGSLETCELSYGFGGTAPRLRAIPRLDYRAEMPPGLAERRRVAGTLADYHDALQARWWSFASTLPPGALDGVQRAGRPPVLRSEEADRNLILPTCAEARGRTIAANSKGKRHRHFGSFRSSQALAQSVFGGIWATGHMDVLAKVQAECGRPAFLGGAEQLELEVEVKSLGEPTPTTLDVFLMHDDRSVAIECKLTETSFGTCSRTEARADRETICNGSYSRQQGRSERCALSEIGVLYWRHAVQLFDWPQGTDMVVCPLAETYQVVRNAFAAGAEGAGHALLVYDARNPAYGPGGRADAQWRAAAGACLVPGLMRRVTWQQIAGTIAQVPALLWLSEGLAAKHGILPP